jgi:hypothetical protein
VRVSAPRGMAKWPHAALVVLLLAYPLSLGPATWLFYRGLLPSPLATWYEPVYRPIAWAASQSSWTNSLFERYLELWLPQDVSIELPW